MRLEDDEIDAPNLSAEAGSGTDADASAAVVVDDELDGDDEEQVFFEGDEPDKGSDSALVRHLREMITNMRRDGAASRNAAVNETPVVIGDKPTIEGCDWDQDKFDEARDAYDARVRAKEEQDRRNDLAQREWADVTRAYSEKRRALPFKDVEEAESTAFSALGDAQQAIIARIADNPAKLIYALGKSPVKLAALSKISNPLLLTKEITKLEATLTTTKGRRPPDPQATVIGRPAAAATRDQTLERLEKAALANGGDRTEVITYKRSLRQKAD